MDETKFIIVVGRSEDVETFHKDITGVLTDEFSIDGIHSLDGYSDVDGKDRYIGFISTMSEDNIENEAMDVVSRLRNMGYGSYQFDSLDEALEYAQDNYGYENDDVKRREKFEEMRRRFPPFSAKEWEQIQIFDSLYHTGKVRPIRGRYNDEEVVVMVHITAGSDEVRVTPMMMLIDEETSDELELPFQ